MGLKHDMGFNGPKRAILEDVGDPFADLFHTIAIRLKCQNLTDRLNDITENMHTLRRINQE